MRRESVRTMAAAAVIAVCSVAWVAQEPQKIQMPQPGVPQIMTMEGRYVRIAYIKKQVDEAFKKKS